MDASLNPVSATAPVSLPPALDGNSLAEPLELAEPNDVYYPYTWVWLLGPQVCLALQDAQTPFWLRETEIVRVNALELKPLSGQRVYIHTRDETGENFWLYQGNYLAQMPRLTG